MLNVCIPSVLTTRHLSSGADQGLRHNSWTRKQENSISDAGLNIHKSNSVNGQIVNKSESRNHSYTRSDEENAKIITAKLKMLRGPAKERFFESVCMAGRANIYHFNTMIASKTVPQDADVLLKKMESMHIVPGVHTFVSLIDIEVNFTSCTMIDLF